MLKNIIQIAGVIDLEEALMLIDQGVDYVGFPLGLKNGREDMSIEDAKYIINKIKDKTNPVLITYLDSANNILELCNYLDVSIIQLHGKIMSQQIQKLKADFPNIQIIKSLIVKEDNIEDLSDEINGFSKHVDFFITDTFDPATGRIGATGKTHDRQISRMLVEQSTIPVILAGGLNPDNVHEAIMKVRPAGVDCHTGVEDSNGRKDAQLVDKFVSESRKGFNDLIK